MKKILIIMSLLSTLTLSVAKAEDTSSTLYGIHLFFNETEFVDTITINRHLDGSLSGHMHVPNDFDAPLENIKIINTKLEFDVLVPKNAARPTDLVFHYRGDFFDSTQKQLLGFVTLKGEADFIASFVGFLRN